DEGGGEARRSGGGAHRAPPIGAPRAPRRGGAPFAVGRGAAQSTLGGPPGRGGGCGGVVPRRRDVASALPPPSLRPGRGRNCAAPARAAARLRGPRRR